MFEGNEIINKLPEKDKNKTHLIAGNIIFFIPSINPILTGLLSLQLIILSYIKNLKYICKGVFDLCNNIYTLLQPSPPKTMEDETENDYSIIANFAQFADFGDCNIRIK
jgi:hypothetical protein